MLVLNLMNLGIQMTIEYVKLAMPSVSLVQVLQLLASLVQVPDIYNLVPVLPPAHRPIGVTMTPEHALQLAVYQISTEMLWIIGSAKLVIQVV